MVLLTFCLQWPQIAVLLISVYQVAKITDMCHQHPTTNKVLKIFIKTFANMEMWLFPIWMGCHAQDDLDLHIMR
jgi:hypothetical protein